jgi:hypothetical protein
MGGVSASANRAGSLDGATGPRWPASPRKVGTCNIGDSDKLKEVIDMLTATKKAAALLKAAKAAEGATGGAGIRLRRGATPNDSEN